MIALLGIAAAFIAVGWIVADGALTPKAKATGIAIMLLGELALGLLLLSLAVDYARAGDLDGRYAQSPLKPWFDQLKSGKGLCCSVADGVVISDPDWETKSGHYRVRIDGEWYAVEDEAVIGEPNRAGKTMAWPYYADGKIHHIRCFMPGAMI